jgi:hypothetical protein
LSNLPASHHIRRRLSPWLLLAAPLLAAAVLLLVLLVRPQSPPPQPPPAVAGGQIPVAELQSELALLRRQVQLMAGQQGAATGNAGAAEPSAKPPAPAPLTQEEVSARDRKRFEGLARKLAAEPLDPRWAPTAERLIADTLAKPVFKGSKLLDATCRSTLCRFEVSHETDAVRSRFGSTLPTRLPSMPSGSMRNAEGSDRKTIVYVAREGHRVPRDELQ